MPTNTSVFPRVLVALLLLPACSSSDDGITMPALGGSAGAPATSGGTPGNGGVVGTGGYAAGAGGSSSGTGGASGTTGGGGASLGEQGGAAQGGTAGTGGAGGSDEPIGGVRNVTAQNATSLPATYRTPVDNPGKWTAGTYPAFYYSTSASAADIFKAPTKQSTSVTKPFNIYTPPDYDPQKQYPYIVVLHGIGNTEDSWYDRSDPKLPIMFDNLIASNDTEPFIAVFPTGTVEGSTGGYYAFGGELMNDLIPFLEANYAVKKDRGSRALAGYSFGGMQTINIGLCAHLKDFAWFAGLHAAGGNFGATDIAKYVAMQNPEVYPLYYFYISVGSSDGTAGGSSAASANGLASKGPYITSANFSFQNNIPGGHVYPSAQVGLYNFLRMAFAPN